MCQIQIGCLLLAYKGEENMRNPKDFILGFMSKVAAGLLAVFLMLPTSANAIDIDIKDDIGGDLIGGDDLIIGGGVQQDCADCYKCVAYNSTTGCTECEYDVNYCMGLEIMDCPEACTYFKSLYSTVLNGGYCSSSSGSVPTGAYNMLISQACSGDSSCASCLQSNSTRYFSAICDSADLSAGSVIVTLRLAAAIELSGIANCSLFKDEDFGEVEIGGSGEPLPPDQCQELLDWCNTDGNWGAAEGKCTELGFTGETFDNCVTMCQDMMDYPLATVITFAASEGVCLACGGGEYYDEASESCKECALGTAQSASIGRHLRTSCTECSPGYYSDSTGRTYCLACPAGQSSSAGAALCTRCFRGTYAPTAGSPECTTCPDGTYADSLGSSACTPCPADENGLTPHSLHTSLQGGLLEPEYEASYSRDSINSCYTDKNTPMRDAVGTYEWMDNYFYGLFE